MTTDSFLVSLKYCDAHHEHRCASSRLPIKLVDASGRNWTALRRNEPLVSKQILMPQLLAGGYDVELVNLKEDREETEYGRVNWRGMELTKVRVGAMQHLDATRFDVCAITINYIQERDIACDLVRQLVGQGGRVVVGGSDAFAEPAPDLQAARRPW